MSRYFGIAIEFNYLLEVESVLSAIKELNYPEFSISNHSLKSYNEPIGNHQSFGAVVVKFGEIEITPECTFFFQNSGLESKFVTFFDWGKVFLSSLKEINHCIKDFYIIEEMIDGYFLDNEIASRFLLTGNYSLIERFRISLD